MRVLHVLSRLPGGAQCLKSSFSPAVQLAVRVIYGVSGITRDGWITALGRAGNKGLREKEREGETTVTKAVNF